MAPVSLAELLDLASSMHIEEGVCLHKLQSEGMSMVKCVLSHRIRLFGPLCYIAHLIFCLLFVTEKCKYPKGTKH